eukprot:Seg1845.11 transcript_id=Seg1845.11/GoldUCD/mRNA.D3Y31 product="hypothetical protein" protein_id=Seg1845.11/GoldUCD/D3Y31
MKSSCILIVTFASLILGGPVPPVPAGLLDDQTVNLNIEDIIDVKDNVAAAEKAEKEKLDVKAASADEAVQRTISEDKTSNVQDQVKDSIKEEVKDSSDDLEESINDEDALPEDEEFQEFLDNKSDNDRESREHDSEEL